MNKFRTLIRGVRITEEYAEVVIPSWSSKVNLMFPKDIFPEEIIHKIDKIADYRFYGKVNLGADNSEELEITDIEIINNITILEKCVNQFLDRFKGCEEWEEFKKGEEKFALFCHSQLSGGIAMKIRNELGLCEDNNEVKDWFKKYYNYEHPDDISHTILIHIHRQLVKNLEKNG